MRISDWSSYVCSSDLLDYAVRPEIRLVEGAKHHSALVAIDPVTQKQAWRVPLPAHFPGGIAATGGGLVFQGQVDSKFNAYDAKTGKLLWSFDAKAPVIAPPITYTANEIGRASRRERVCQYG